MIVTLPIRRTSCSSSSSSSVVAIYPSRSRPSDGLPKRSCGSGCAVRRSVRTRTILELARAQGWQRGKAFRARSIMAMPVTPATLLTPVTLGFDPLHSLRPLGSFRFRYGPLHSASGSLLGLEHLHVSGICHRDIKPENILWDTKAKVAQRAPTPTLGTSCCHDHPTLTSIHNDTTHDTQVAKLTDFGVSDFFDNEHIGGDFIQVGLREGERGWWEVGMQSGRCSVLPRFPADDR